MDMAIINNEGLVVAVDLGLKEGGRENSPQNSIVKVECFGEQYQVSSGLIKEEGTAAADLDDGDLDTSEAEIQKLLYWAETLRKMDSEDVGDVE